MIAWLKSDNRVSSDRPLGLVGEKQFLPQPASGPSERTKRVDASGVVKRRGELGEVLDESTTVASEAEEGADLDRVGWFRVLVDRARRGKVDANTSGTNEMAEVSDLSVPDVALRRLAHEAAGLDRREYSAQVRDVLFVRLRVDDDVADVHTTGTARDAIGERSVHHELEYRGLVDETKRRRSTLKQAAVCDEGCLVALFARHGYLPKARAEDEARENSIARSQLGQSLRWSPHTGIG